jgi:hypothetical protein
MQVAELGLNINTYAFSSGANRQSAEASLLHDLRNDMIPNQEDEKIEENGHFRYPVFYPSGNQKYKRAILLLHGLNERKWDKYYTWANFLVEQLQVPVILFPISFHLNRSPESWVDPRLLAGRVESRKKSFAQAEDSTFLNLALSERLTEHPERFYLSGIQTIDDLTTLIRSIQAGTHPLFEKDSLVDFFSYSIGGLLSQVLMIANPGGIIDKSRFFFFSAGSTFCDMHGASRLIMDTPAHEKVQHFYRVELESQLQRKGRVTDFFHGTKLGNAFRSMVAPDRYRQLRDKTFLSFQNRITAVAVDNDLVIPADKILETFEAGGKNSNVTILKPEYPYTHENPFPLKLSEYSKQMELIFNQVFGKAVAFLA